MYMLNANWMTCFILLWNYAMCYSLKVTPARTKDLVDLIVSNTLYG